MNQIDTLNSRIVTVRYLLMQALEPNAETRKIVRDALDILLRPIGEIVNDNE